MPTCNVLNRLKAARKMLKQKYEFRYLGKKKNQYLEEEKAVSAVNLRFFY